MAVVYHEIYLPIDTESTFDYIVIKQGDAGTHKVRATLISNNRVYTIPTSGASYFMKFRKPDNNYCLVEATVSDNTISAEVTEEMLRVSGTGRGEFMIVSGSNELKTATFHVKIVKETFTSGDVQSHSDFAPFAVLLQGAGAAASNANTAAAAANAAASLAAQKAQAIPDDYSDLVAEVEEVKADLGDVTEVVDVPGDYTVDTSDFVKMTGYCINLNEPHNIMAASGVSMLYVECEPNKKYTITKTVSKRFQVAYTEEVPASGVSTYGYVRDDNAASIDIVTGSNAAYLVVYYKHSSDTLTESEIYASIAITYRNILLSAIDYGARDTIVKNSVRVPTEHGNMGYSTGRTICEYTNIAKRYKTALPVEVEPSSTIDIGIYGDSTGVFEFRVLEYAADRAFVQSQLITGNTITVSATTKYIMFIIPYENAGHDPEYLILSSYSKLRIVKGFKVRTDYERFTYEVYPGVYTTGVLMLPPNYDLDGKPVPVMIYGHGSNGYYKWETTMGELYNNQGTYFPYMEYLRDEGFAVFDCFGLSSKYITSMNDVDANSNFGSHIVVASYMAGIRYILSRYNLDADNVNMYVKSLGGFIGAVMANQTDINIKTVSMLCPWINNMTSVHTGWSVEKRTMLADDWELEGDVENIFLVDGFDSRSEVGQEFISLNLPHIVAINPGWQYDGQTAEQKQVNTKNMDWTHTDCYRKITCPVKIWCARDDDSISYSMLREYVMQCQNSGYDATLRVMPNGTGGHHSVDTDTNALKQNVTTALGIYHADVPTAYVEMVQFVRSRQR